MNIKIIKINRDQSHKKTRKRRKKKLYSTLRKVIVKIYKFVGTIFLIYSSSPISKV